MAGVSAASWNFHKKLIFVLVPILVVISAPEAGCSDSDQSTSSVAINGADTVWMVVSTFLVLIMTPGLAFFYAGFVDKGNSVNVHMMSYVALPIISIQWFLFGYSIAFAPDFGSKLIGDLRWGCFSGIDSEPNADYGRGIPQSIHASYQMMFAVITPALASGTLVGRIRFRSYCVFLFMWTTFVYCVIAHWVWGGTGLGGPNESLGWLRKMGVLDYGGGAVVHLSAGMSSLVGSFILGKRKNYMAPLKPHNTSTILLGTALLWIGWLGFNGGNSLASDGMSGFVVLNTHLSACGGMAVWMLLDVLYNKKPSASQACIGAVVGLVCSTPGCAYIRPWASLLGGGVLATVSFYVIRLRTRYWLYDDVLDVFAAHGMGGWIGMIWTGLFATKDVNPLGSNGAFYGNGYLLGVQILCCVVVSLLSVTMTAGIFYGLKYSIGLRVTEKEEDQGLDSLCHGEDAFFLTDVVSTGQGSTPFVSKVANGVGDVSKAERHNSWTASASLVATDEKYKIHPVPV